MQKLIQEFSLSSKQDFNYTLLYTNVSLDIENNSNFDSALHSAFAKLLCSLVKLSPKEKVLACMFCDCISSRFLERFQKSTQDLIQAIYVSAHVCLFLNIRLKKI
jgi:hypothetical protein